MCSISDGLSEVSHSPGSQQIRGFACFRLCGAHQLYIFFQQRLSSRYAYELMEEEEKEEVALWMVFLYVGCHLSLFMSLAWGFPGLAQR